MADQYQRYSPQVGTLKVVASYAVFAALWILLSDRVLGWLVRDPELIVRASVAKGWLFVLVTALLLYALLRRLVAHLQASHRREVDAERAKQQALQLLGAISESSGDAVFAKDLQGRYLLFNQAAAALSGVSAAAVIGNADEAVFPPEQADSSRAADRDILAEGRTVTRERACETPQGPRRLLETRGPLRDAGAEIVGTFGILRDVTDLRRVESSLHESERRFEATFEQAAVGIALVAPDGRWLRVNRKLCEIVGYEQDELLQRSFQDITHRDDLDADLHNMGRMLAREIETFSTEKRYLRKDGGVVWINLTVSLVWTPEGVPDYFISVVEDIRARKNVEAALKESRQHLLLFIEHAPAALAMFDRDMRCIAASRRWRERFGLGDGDVVGRSHYEIFPDLPERWKHVHRRALAGEVIRSDEDRFERADGTTQWVSWEVRPWYADDGSVGGIVIFSEDIGRQKRAELELRIAATAFESQQAMFITDRNYAILRANQAFSDVTGYGPGDVLGRSPAMLDAGRHDDGFYRAIAEALERNRYWQGEIWGRRRNGDAFPALASVSAVVDAAGAVTNYVAAFVDISQRKQAEALIHNLSFYDALTGLPNRRLLLDRMRQALLSSRRKGVYGAVLFVDLDDFRSVNDTRGHEVGDVLLAAIAERIRDCVHGEDTVARTGGDEFVVVLDSLSGESEPAATQARDVAERIRAVVREPMDLAGQEYECTASIGISLFRAEGATVEGLLKQADASMFQAKRTGRDSIHFFDAAMQAALEERVQMEGWLRRALPDQLELHYQMQVDADGRIVGAEALIRWQHPERGLIPPAAFIPLAEDSGLILPIGRWVLETACRQLKAWETSAATRHLLLAVNVSAKQFQQPDFVEQVAEVLATTGADPANLKLELTESMLLDNVETVVRKMAALKETGIRFSLDDFGTGFSSLAYLKRLPLDQLKIDRSFVRDVLSDANDAAIVRTIIALGQSLGLAVIAEGVETEAQRDFLAVHGCGFYQGYFFGRPVPLTAFEERLGRLPQLPG